MCRPSLKRRLDSGVEQRSNFTISFSERNSRIMKEVLEEAFVNKAEDLRWCPEVEGTKPDAVSASLDE